MFGGVTYKLIHVRTHISIYSHMNQENVRKTPMYVLVEYVKWYASISLYIAWNLLAPRFHYYTLGIYIMM